MKTRQAWALVGTALIAASACGAPASAPTAVRSADVRSAIRQPTAYVVSPWSNSVTPVVLSTRRAGRPIRPGRRPYAIAIAPDGSRLYVALAASGDLAPILIADDKVGRRIRTGSGAGWNSGNDVVITPDGKTVYLLKGETLVPVDVATGKAGKPINVVPRGWHHTDAMAITPDGATIYVVDDGGLVPVSTPTGMAGKPIPLPLASSPHLAMVLGRIVITPDGKTIYAVTAASQAVDAVDTASGTVRAVIRVGTRIHSAVDALTITADGKTVYVGDYGDDAIVPISTATNTAGRPITVGKPGRTNQGPTFVAVTPDGKTAYAATPKGLYPVNLAADRAGRALRVAPPPATPAAVAFTPDGKTAWVISWRFTFNETYRGTLTPVTVATGKAGAPIKVGKQPACLLLATAGSASRPACNSLVAGLPI